MSVGTEESEQGRISQRLESMGIRGRLMQGGRCILASMRFVDSPIETLNGSLTIPEVVFSTVGREHIKILRPQTLFMLPLIRIVDCRSAASIESRIRNSWKKYCSQLQETEAWLSNLGTDVNSARHGATLTVSMAGEEQPIRLQTRGSRKIILPSRGPLSGITLQRAEDRVLQIDSSVQASVDFDIEVASRFEELRRLDSRIKDDERRRSLRGEEPVVSIANNPDARSHRIMLVGPHLSEQRSCIDSLRLRNYEVQIAATEAEALSLFDKVSPELILADVSLGRSEGIELIPALRSLVGVEELPVILVDTHRRDALRKAAQAAGAMGYLTYPIEVSQIASHLEKLVEQPKRRRFTRYKQQLSIKVGGHTRPSTATRIGRGGILLRTQDHLETASIHRYDLTLPSIGKRLRFEGEVIYQLDSIEGQEMGVRFHKFSPQNEEVLINYLHCLQ